MNVNDGKKLVTVWLTNGETYDDKLKAGLEDVYAEYSAKKYLVAVFESGREELYDNTLALLKYNRQKSAEEEVKRDRQGTANS